MEEKVLLEINQLITRANDSAFWESVAKQKVSDTQQKAQSLTNLIKNAETRKKELSVLLTTAYEDKVKGVINDDVFVILVKRFRQEQEQLHRQSQQFQEQLEIAHNYKSGLEHMKEMITHQEHIAQLNRDIVGKFVDRIAVYPVDRSTKPYRQRIDIHYHFIGKL